MRPQTWHIAGRVFGLSYRLRSRCNSSKKLVGLSQQPYSSLDNIRERSQTTNLVFHSTTDNPYNNLAVEHYLLTNSDPESKILLFYTNRPCVVIGRNQNPWVECNLELIRQQDVDLVRRRSGGGTVFHDVGNLNFSVIVPNDKEFNRKKHAEMIVRALKSSPSEKRQFEDIWVNDRHDITIRKEGKQFKVSGSAFKLTRGRALHHGTILHSSPNLGDISRFLRSPGRDYIQAKGVESVRSPVSNLFNSKAHDELRAIITRSIVKEFQHLYGKVVEQDVGHQDRPKEAVEGAEELMTDDWKYGQTPRFEFKGKVIEDKQIFMLVNRGIVEDASFNSRPVLHQIKDWNSIVHNTPPELIDQLDQFFPTFPHVAGELAKEMIIERNNKKLSRRLGDGTTEVEEVGHNTINIIK